MAVTSLYATSGTLGVSLGAIWSVPTSAAYSAGDQPPFALGQMVTATDGSVWVYVQFGTGGVTETGYACVYDVDFGAVMLSTSNDTYNNKVGIPACGAAIATDYGWLQIFGSCDAIRVAATTDPNVDLVATATAGELDDDVATGPFVKGVVLTTARGGTAGTAPGVLNYPMIDVLYEPET